MLFTKISWNNIVRNAKFNDHIEKVSKKIRQKVGWILRSFYTRSLNHMKQLWKSLVQCHIDYCSQLYMPCQNQGIQKNIETGLYLYNETTKYYWDWLNILKMSTPEKRNERLYVYGRFWKDTLLTDCVMLSVLSGFIVPPYFYRSLNHHQTSLIGFVY